MDVRLVDEPPADADIVCTPVFADRLAEPPTDLAGFADVAGFVAACGFTAEPGETLAFPGVVAGGSRQPRLVYGVGASDALDVAVLRRAAAGVARATRRHPHVSVHLPALPPRYTVGAAVEGFRLGGYPFPRYRAQAHPARTERPAVSTPTPADATEATEATEALRRAGRVADAVELARDLGNEPGGILTPVAFADRMVDVAAERGLSCTVWDERRIADERLGGLLGVSRGSTQPPRLVIVTHEPSQPAGSVALVGKGVTFDAGGLSLKPNKMMLPMKIDMAGAAAVFAAMSALPALGCPVRVAGYLPLTDNMPGGDATRLGDVLRIRNGTTVEVRNADAEGRLMLADALALAAESGPDAIVDIATLTGALSMAVGNRFAGLAGSHAGWTEQVGAAAARAGEPVWPLPIDADRKELRSKIADLVNVNGRPSGQSSLAALFLRQFVPAGIPWAHLDINGPAFSDEDDGELTAGATGFGVRTLLELLCNPAPVRP